VALAGTVSLPVVVLATVAGGSSGTSGAGGAANGAVSRQAQIPPDWLAVDQAAAATCPGLPWTVLAAIGTVETDNGRSTLPGVASGANGAGAEGPMQFEPATFAAYAEPVPPGGASPPSPYDLTDATYAAARLLCAGGGGAATGLAGALYAYNHDRAYVDTVLALALAYGDDPATSMRVVTVVTFAVRALGVPYVWGGESPSGYDCSGLVQAAERSAGITLPRTAQDQFDAGPPVADGTADHPGDLVFFGAGLTGIEHVGIYVGGGEMIDAPYTGTVVRFDAAAQPELVGTTDPN
jgi:cell wall-associated NlpC family hydrolase